MPEEESKLVEKLEEKQSAVKFSDEELNTVKEIQQEYVNIQNQFGQIAMTKIRIEDQMDNILRAEEENRKKLLEVQTKERKFLDGITEKYGEGTLNPDTGEFIPNKS